MSVQSEINRITNAVSDAYGSVEEMGGTVPASATIANLASAINTIPQTTAWGEITGTLSDQSDLNNRLTSIETDLDTAESDIDDLETEMTGKVSKSGDTMTGTLIISAGTPLEYIQSGTTIDMAISSSEWTALTTWYNNN